MDATVVVVAAESVGPDTIALTFETPADFSARPGQFVKLTGAVDGEEYSRFYTLSSPGVEDTFEITIGIDPDEAGPFSVLLADLEPGDELEMSGPFGKSYYEDEPRAVVLAGGPGVGPAVGIAERALGDGHDVAVVYLDDQPAHEARLEGLVAMGGTVVMDAEDADLADHVDDVIRGDDGEQVFVYGFADFVDRAREAIEHAGGDVDAAKVESFG